MPYHVGAKGSNGCSGYPAVKEGGEVMGCHATEAEALAQVQALYANEAEKSDSGITPSQTSSDEAIYPNLGIKKPTQGKAGDSTTGGNVKSKYGKKPKHMNRGAGGNPNDSTGAIATTSATSMGTKSDEDFWAGSAFSKRKTR
jgi:hypothetical protein